MCNRWTPGGVAVLHKLTNFKLISQIYILGIFTEIALSWMQWDPADD